MVVIELNKLGDVLKKPVAEMTPLEMWSTFLGYAADPEKRILINEVLERKAAIGLAGTVLAAISKDEHERARFLSRRKFEMEMTSNLLTAEAQGELNAKREVARNMKAESLSVESIARMTKLSVSDIEKL